MKLMFNKTNYEGHWFNDNENPVDYTEKVPLNTGFIFNEETNDWVLKREPEEQTER
jgi:hypothetical protein